MKKIIIIFTSIILIILLWNLSRSKDYQIFGKIINRINTSEKIVALTFDDGPTINHTDQIIEILNSTNIKATFFLVGKYIEENPQEFKKIVDHGHEIGNHSYSHSKLHFSTKERIENEIINTENILENLIGNTAQYFRPPHGFFTPTILSTARKLNKIVVMWTINSYDFDIRSSQDTIIKKVVSHIEPGSIVLFHDGHKLGQRTATCLKTLLPILKKRGYFFSSLPI